MQLLERFPEGSLGVVLHGAVISLFAAGRAGIMTFHLWSRLGLPAAVCLPRPELELLDKIEAV